ncbi:hypothetical protein [Comamonas sp.]|uniref:hypothetical protein n=1 Tax=Comamonas sp. TaxID=34028 RepID=UPI0012C84ED1|nr:hypothetical protein [Comamonas sp.]MPS92992.1 hypothetical protein [Comamonas sp.]
MNKILLSLLTLPVLALSYGCSDHISDITVERLNEEKVWKVGNSLLGELTSPLSSKTNSYHSYTKSNNEEQGEEAYFEKEKLTNFYINECKSLFKINKNDVGYESKGLGRGTYFIKDISFERLVPFKECITNKYNNEAIDELSLRIFLTEPNLLKYKNDMQLKKHITQIKKDNKITLKEVVDTYSILDKLSIDNFDNENKNLFNEL